MDDKHPVKRLSPYTCREVGTRLNVTRIAAYYRLLNNDEEAWSVALEIESARKDKAKQIARRLADVQNLIEESVE